MSGAASENETRQVREGAVLAGKFEVVRELGRGGMGAVYEVRHRYTGRRLALKLLLPEHLLSEAHTRRFLQEAAIAGRTDSEHIVKIVDADRFEDGTPYLVMELLFGSSLDELVLGAGPDRISRRLPPRTALQVVHQACLGVQAAHDVGIIHRDIKPANLFVEQLDPPRVKVVDFGISRFAETRPQTSPLTAAGSTLGTPGYMSPEHMLGEELSFSTDVFSLGVVLYECLTGRLPFLGARLEELLREIRAADFPKPSAEVPGLPPLLDRVVSLALAPERAHRYNTAAQLAQALSEALRGLPDNAGRSRPSPAAGEPPGAQDPTQPVLGSRPTVGDATSVTLSKAGPPRNLKGWWLLAASIALSSVAVALLLGGSGETPAGPEAAPPNADANGLEQPPASTQPAPRVMPVSSGAPAVTAPIPPPKAATEPPPKRPSRKPRRVPATKPKVSPRPRSAIPARAATTRPADAPAAPAEPKTLKGDRGRIYNDFD